MMVVALTAWVMAANHCELRASGIFSDHVHLDDEGDCSGADSDGCLGKTCGVAESEVCRPDSGDVKVSAPDFFACLCELCAVADGCLGMDSGPTRAWVEPSDSADWVPQWSFERRAAAPAHAPDPLIA